MDIPFCFAVRRMKLAKTEMLGSSPHPHSQLVQQQPARTAASNMDETKRTIFIYLPFFSYWPHETLFEIGHHAVCDIMGRAAAFEMSQYHEREQHRGTGRLTGDDLPVGYHRHVVHMAAHLRPA